ncbi:hypothetical protein YC2023_026829 [Brassica napus]
MRNQIDVIDLESNPKVSTETPSYSGVEPELEPADRKHHLFKEAGGNVIVSEITSQPENEDYKKTTGLLPITTTTPEIPVDSSVATFVPLIGAWAKPLAFIPPATPPMPATPSGLDPQHLNNLIDSFWPTLTEGLVPNQKKRDHSNVVREFPRMPVHIANGSNSPLPILPLVDSQSAPTKATTMEEISSPVIVLEANLVSTDKSLLYIYSTAHKLQLIKEEAVKEIKLCRFACEMRVGKKRTRV